MINLLQLHNPHPLNILLREKITTSSPPSLNFPSANAIPLPFLLTKYYSRYVTQHICGSNSFSFQVSVRFKYKRKISRVAF